MSFKICSIGCSSFVTNTHGPSMRKYADVNPDVELTACCAAHDHTAKEFREKFGFIKYYTDYIKMLDTEKPDAVCLMSPVHLTSEFAVRIIEMGYPLILEKPPGRDREETLRIIDAAEKYNVPNQVACNRRYTPLVRELKKLLVHGFKADEIHNICYDFYRVDRIDEDFSTTAFHGIDTVKYLADSDYKYVSFKYQALPQLEEHVANIFMDCKFYSGATAQLRFCPVSGVVVERTAVNTCNNTFFLNIPMWKEYDSPGRLMHIRSNQLMLDVTGDMISDGPEMFELSGFYYENAYFFDCIRKGLRPDGDVKTTLQSVEIADCIRKRLTEYRG